MLSAIEVIDEHVLLWFFAHRSAWATSVMLGITQLASTLAVLVIGALVLFILWRKGAYWSLIGFLGALSLGNLARIVLKDLIARPRPPAAFQVYQETGYSFPSGHTLSAVMLYGFVAYIIWQYAPRPLRIVGVILSATIIMAVGLSRMYLGVHYLCDVIAGAILGGVFLASAIYATRRDGRIEKTAA